MELTTHPSSLLADDRSDVIGRLGITQFRFSPELVSTASGATAILVGGLVLAGWALGLPGLRGIHPALATMVPRTAVCFVFAGVGLWLLGLGTNRRWTRRLGGLSAMIVIAFSLLALGLSWFEWFPNVVPQMVNPPGATVLSARMPAATAMAFLCLGFALLLLDVEIRRFRPSEFLTFGAVLIVLLALIAYNFGFVSLFHTPVRRPLAIHTLFAFLALSLGTLLVRPYGGLMFIALGNTVGGVMVRRLLPAAVAIPVFVGWLIAEGERAKLYPAALNLAYYALAIVVIFSTLIWLTAGALHQMDIERQRAEEQLRELNAELEQRVMERTAQLEVSNKELEAFSYSVSHDLRAPLRAIDGFSRILLEDYCNQLGEEGKDLFRRVCAACQRMGQLIDDLLSLSRVSRNPVRRENVDLSALASAVIVDLARLEPGRSVQITIGSDLSVNADPNLMRIVLENLLGNAWKFTRRKQEPKIEVGATKQADKTIYFVRDDGAGFDMSYAEKLFGAFQRLHRPAEFEGTGIGLSIVQRIIHRHGGQVWAEGAVEMGATIYFTLPS